MVDQRRVGFMPHRRDQRDQAVCGGAHHHLLVEAPQILDRAAAPRHDDDIGARHRATRGQGIEAADRRRHLCRAFVALHCHRPDHHLAGKAVTKPVQDVADDGPRWRGHDPDHPRQIGDRLFPPRIKQPLRRQRRPALFQHQHQRTHARRGDIIDNQLIFRLAGKGGHPPGGHHLDPFFRADLQFGRLPFPDDRRDGSAVILEVEIKVARRRARHPADLAAHPDQPELALDHPFHRARQFGHGEFRGILADRGVRLFDEVRHRGALCRLCRHHRTWPACAKEMR